MSSSSANPCNGAEIQCNGVCTNTSNNNAHCSACNAPCTPQYVGGTAQCANSTCGQSCPAGTALLNGRCAVLAGEYQTHGMGCGAPACRRGNPYTGGCNCPAGFSPFQALNVLDDSNCPDVTSGPWGWSLLWACLPTAGSVPSSDFGGLYNRNRLNNVCETVNPYTGACSCPGGYNAVTMPVSSACFHTTDVVACVGTGTITSYGGSFLVRDPNVCLVGNPRTGGCSCPAGFYANGMRAIVGPVQTNTCSDNGQSGAFIYFCQI